MISKIIKIKGVGKFLNTNPSSNANFRQSNIIYALNGSGKTTLTSIFRSLSQNDEKVIENRKSFDYKEEQDIQILIDNKPFRYTKGGKWTNSGYPDIEVFDIFFVNDNVFSGFEVLPDNRKNLHKFLLSKEIIDLDNDINQIKNEISAVNNKISDLTGKLNSLKGDFTLEGFLKFQGDEQELIGKKLAFGNYIEQYNNKDMIRAKEQLRTINPFSIKINLEKLKELLLINIESVSNQYSSYVELFENRKKSLDKYFGNKTEAWLLQGFKAINIEGYDCGCPFCSNTEFTSNQIIYAYGQFFNDFYNSVKNEISKSIIEFSQISVDTFEAKCQTNTEVNSNNNSFWKKYLFEITNPVLGIKDECNEIKECINLILDILSKKMSSPLVPIDPNIIDRFQMLIIHIEEKLSNYNNEVSSANTLIAELKKEKYNINLLRLEYNKVLKGIERIKNKDIIQICMDYEQIALKKKELEEVRTQKQSELKNKTVALFKKYSKTMNRYLNSFNTPIRIKEIKSQAYSSPDNFADYTFELGISEIKPNQVKHTLSEGDKSSIAFSFFLAKLTEDVNIGEKIIIIDDPLSSLDSNRRQRTIEAIEKISEKAKQVILMSHDEFLLFDIYERGKMTDIHTLNIDGQANICSWDIEQAMEHPYFKVIKELNEFIQQSSKNVDIDNIRSKIRKAIEGTLKFRYFKYLDEETILPNGKTIPKFDRKFGLGKMIDKLKFSSCSFKIKDKERVIERLVELNEYSNPPNHDNSDISHRQVSTNELELRGFIRDTLELIHEML